MSKMKQRLIDSKTTDPVTGARLTPRPEQRVGVLSVEPTRGDWKVGRSAMRGRGMYNDGRWCEVQGEKKDFSFRCQTTKEFENGVVPDEDGGYQGRVVLDEFERVVAGRCSCPAWKDEYSVLPNDAIFCKHMEMARYKMLLEGPTQQKEVVLELGWSLERQEEKVMRVKVNGRFREPKNESAEVARTWLVEHGYDLKGTSATPDGYVRQVYRR